MLRWLKYFGGQNDQVTNMLRWRRCLRERTRMGTGSWTRRSGIGCSTLLAAELPCEINNVLLYHVGEDDFQDNICGAW